MGASRPVRVALLGVLLYLTWLGMMAVHEAGHAVHAWFSGGRGVQVELPLLGFSRTDVSHNPHPLFVTWGGAIWGVAVPLASALIARRLRWRYSHVAQFFAGFCLVANGAYLGAGAFGNVGDAGDLVRDGVPVWALALLGAGGLMLGLWLWNGLGPHSGLGGRRDPGST